MTYSSNHSWSAGTMLAVGHNASVTLAATDPHELFISADAAVIQDTL